MYNPREYALRTFGMDMPRWLTDEEWNLLANIRKAKEMAKMPENGIHHEPEFRIPANGIPIMADIPVDEEFSKLCSKVWE